VGSPPRAHLEPVASPSEVDQAIALGRKIEAVVVAQTSNQPSGLSPENERIAARHLCKVFPPAFGLRDESPDSLNEVSFLIVRHLVRKAEERRLAMLRAQSPYGPVCPVRSSFPEWR
jgi:hypothetical protein